MKKILMGLLAVSAVSFAAIDLETSDTGKNAFTTGKEGRIAVTGNLTSEVTPVKYVVYASADGSGTYNGTAGETLALPNFVLSFKPKSSTTGFAGATLPKVFVRRVNEGNDGVDNLSSEEKVYFKVNVDSQWTGRVSEWMTANDGKSVGYGMITYLSKEQLREIANTIDAGLIINDLGALLLNNKSVTFSSTMVIKSVENGVLQIEEVTTNASSDSDVSPTIKKKIEAAFSGLHAITNVSISAKVE